MNKYLLYPTANTMLHLIPGTKCTRMLPSLVKNIYVLQENTLTSCVTCSIRCLDYSRPRNRKKCFSKQRMDEVQQNIACRGLPVLQFISINMYDDCLLNLILDFNIILLNSVSVM